MPVVFITKCVERKKEYQAKQKLSATQNMPRTKTENPNAYYNTLMNIFECSKNLPTPIPHPTPHH